MIHMSKKKSQLKKNKVVVPISGGMGNSIDNTN